MPYPAGLPTKMLTFGRYSSALGNTRGGTIKVGFDLPALHVPTGEVITSGFDSVTVNPITGMAQIEVPVTVTPDLLTIPDNLENQRLRVAVMVDGYPTDHKLLDIHPDDPSTMDFDQLVPYSSSGGIPVLRATVSSVAGLTGDIAVGDLAAELSPYFGGAGDAGQITVTGAAGAALSGQRVVTRNEVGEMVYASSDNPDHMHAPLMVTTGAVSAGAVAAAVSYGEMTEGSWGWTPGPVFLGSNGFLTQVVPTQPGSVFLVQVGIATSATRIFIDRQQPIQLI